MTAQLFVYTGTNAGTKSAPQTAIALLPTDSASTTPAAIAKGSNSYEKWVRVEITNESGTFSDFWVERTGSLPDGTVIRLGMTGTPATPTNATSTVATTVMAEGRRYIFDIDPDLIVDGYATCYLVLQGQLSADTDSGAIEQQVFTVGYATS